VGYRVLMRLAFAFLADAAQTTADGKLWVFGGDIEDIVAAELPVTVAALALVVKLLLTEEESERAHQLRLQFVQPDGTQQLPPFEFPFHARRRTQELGMPYGVSLVFNFQQLVFFSHGQYMLRMAVDGRHLGDVQFSLRVR